MSLVQPIPKVGESVSISSGRYKIISVNEEYQYAVIEMTSFIPPIRKKVPFDDIFPSHLDFDNADYAYKNENTSAYDLETE